MKLTKDRLWLLKSFEWGGWTAQPNLIRVAKWDAHRAALVKLGLLEPDEYGEGLHRITPAGREALEKESEE